MNLNRTGKPEKVYAKLEADLRKMIYNNELSFTQPLSGEIRLAETYNISRESVRKALRNLVADGLLRKVNGLGTFVVPPDQRRNKLDKPLNVMIFGPDGAVDNPLARYERELFSGFSECTRNTEHKYSITLFDSFNLEKVVKDFNALKFDAILWDRPPEPFSDAIHHLQIHGVPQVTLNTPIPSIPFIEMDFERSINDILYFMKNLGHRNIMFIDEEIEEHTKRYEGRRNIFIESLRQMGHLNPEDMFIQVSKKTPWKDLVKKVVLKASAVILANIRCYRNFKQFCVQERLKIPEDITAVVHLDHDELRENDICAYSHDRHEVGKQAFDILVKLTRQELVPQQTLVQGNLIIRRSYACKKQTSIKPS